MCFQDSVSCGSGTGDRMLRHALTTLAQTGQNQEKACAGPGGTGSIAMISRLKRWLVQHVTEVPEEIAVCEFDCSKLECLHEDWANCPRRLGLQNPQQRTENRKIV